MADREPGRVVWLCYDHMLLPYAAHACFSNRYWTPFQRIHRPTTRLSGRPTVFPARAYSRARNVTGDCVRRTAASSLVSAVIPRARKISRDD